MAPSASSSAPLSACLCACPACDACFPPGPGEPGASGGPGPGPAPRSQLVLLLATLALITGGTLALAAQGAGSTLTRRTRSLSGPGALGSYDSSTAYGAAAAAAAGGRGLKPRKLAEVPALGAAQPRVALAPAQGRRAGPGGRTRHSRILAEEPCSQACADNHLLLQKVNQLRKAWGLRALCLSNKLIAAAQGLAQDTSTGNLVNPATGWDRESIEERIQATGFQWSGYGSAVARNETAEGAFCTLRSAKHRRETMLGKYGFMGAQQSNGYWALILASSSTEACNA